MGLTHYLNLTMVQVCEHQGVLYELDTRLLIFNKTFISTMLVLSHVWYKLSILTDVCMTVTSLPYDILSLNSFNMCTWIVQW